MDALFFGVILGVVATFAGFVVLIKALKKG